MPPPHFVLCILDKGTCQLANTTLNKRGFTLIAAVDTAVCIRMHHFQPRQRPSGQSDGQKTGTQGQLCCFHDFNTILLFRIKCIFSLPLSCRLFAKMLSDTSYL